MTSTILNYTRKATSILGLFLVFMSAYHACTPLEEEIPLLMSIDHMDFESEGSLMELNPPFLTGEFSLTASGLSASTSYYFRVFAKMKTTTVYSEEKTFTTRPAAEDMQFVA